MPQIRFWQYTPSELQVTYSFYNEVMASISGEQRFNMRPTPRVYMDMVCQLSDAEVDTVKTLIRDQMSETSAVYRNKFYVPRFDLQYPASLDALGTEFTVDTTGIDTEFLDTYKFSYQIVADHIFWVSQSYTSSAITVDGTYDLSAYGDTSGYICPVSTFRLAEAPTFSRAGFNDNTVTLKFHDLDYAPRSFTTTPFSLETDGRAILDKVPSAVEGFSNSVVFPEQVIDYGHGLISYEPVAIGLEEFSDRIFQFQGQSEYNYFLKFVEFVGGMHRKFYAKDTAASVSNSTFRLNTDEVVFSLLGAGLGQVTMPFKLLEGSDE